MVLTEGTFMTDDQSNMSSSASDPVVVEGIGGAPGIAIGSVHRYRLPPPEIQQRNVDPSDVEEELQLFDDAVSRAERELEKTHALAQDQLGEEGEALLEAQTLMLQDEEVLGAVRQRITENHESAAHALSSVLRAHRRRLEESEDDYLRERAGDLEELEARLLQILQRNRTVSTVQPNAIVVAERLTAADLIRFHRHGILGCVTTKGGETSHVSIIARALNLPAIVGADTALDVVANGDRVILDGRQGHLIVHPADEIVESYRQRRSRNEALLKSKTEPDDHPTTTADGEVITVQANVEFGETLDSLGHLGGDGIGLMRTEMLFLSGDEMVMDENEQAATYRKAAEVTGTHGATIRLLDLGGDKLFSLPGNEANPFLGWRGIRVLLDRPESLLRPQLRALLRANVHGALRVLLPMVTQVSEVERVREMLAEEARRLDTQDIAHDADLPLGVMVEVPAVALQANLFAESVDFLSIGTNDLTQYVLAVDRGNDRVANRYDALHPAVLHLLRRTVEAGEFAETPVSLCGEVASDLYALPVLLGLGLRRLSVSMPSLPEVMHAISQISVRDAEDLATAALSASDADAVRRTTRDWCRECYDADLTMDLDN